MTSPIYAIGDIHGQLSQLERVLSLIDADGGAAAKTVFLGDYTDRGPDSRGVIDTLIAEQEAGRDWVFLKGNHDRMFEWFMEVPPRHDPYLLVDFHWLHDRIGGIQTLASYGVNAGPDQRLKDVHADALMTVPDSHVNFLRALTLTHQTETLFFAHAGIRPGVPLADQGEEDLVWIRQDFHNFRGPHPKLIVHGHTPVERPTHYGNRVNLDSAAGYGADLTAAVFEGDEVFILSERGRRPLTPIR